MRLIGRTKEGATPPPVMSGFWDENLVAGDETSRRQARAQARQRERLALAMKSGWPELARKDLVFGRVIVHEPTGEFFHLVRGEVYGGGHDPVDAYYIDAAGYVEFLQRPSGGPQTRLELAQRRAEREQRQAAPIRVRGRT